MTPVKVDDGQTLWFDWNEFGNLTMEDIENLYYDKFDVFNVPENSFLESDKYYITYFNCRLGYCAMFLKKRRK